MHRTGRGPTRHAQQRCESRQICCLVPLGRGMRGPVVKLLIYMSGHMRRAVCVGLAPASLHFTNRPTAGKVGLWECIREAVYGSKLDHRRSGRMRRARSSFGRFAPVNRGTGIFILEWEAHSRLRSAMVGWGYDHQEQWPRSELSVQGSL